MSSGVGRLGVMPIYNLSSDAQLDWRGRAASAVVVYDLAGERNLFATQVDSLSAAQAARASRLLEGYFVERNGRIGIHAELENLAKRRAAQVFDIEGTASAGFLPLINELARKISPQARRFGTDNEQAFRFYGEALESKDAQDIERGLSQASEADPGFAAPYVDEAKILSRSGDKDRALQAIQEAERARLDPIERANARYVKASAGGDARGRMEALAALGGASPSNPSIFFELGELRFARREFEEAAKEFRETARIDPDSPGTWNQLGYTLAWMGDLKGARDALAQYQKLSPADENVLDSLGEVSYMDGDFKSASDYFERAGAKNPAEFVKAAEARSMMGDRQGADALFAKALGPNATRNAGGAYQMAGWEYWSGREQAAMARMQTLAEQATGNIQALAQCELSLWKLQAGERNPMSESCLALASRSTGYRSKLANAVALLFANRIGEALPVLQALYTETNPVADGEVRSLLAWAYARTGQMAEARKLVAIYPLPLSSGDPLFATIAWKRFSDARREAGATK